MADLNSKNQEVFNLDDIEGVENTEQDGGDDDYDEFVRNMKEGQKIIDEDTNEVLIKINGTLIPYEEYIKNQALSQQGYIQPPQQQLQQPPKQQGFLGIINEPKPPKKTMQDKFQKVADEKQYQVMNNEAIRKHKEYLLGSAFEGQFYYVVYDLKNGEEFAKFVGKMHPKKLVTLIYEQDNFHGGRYKVDFCCSNLAEEYKNDIYDSRIFEIDDNGDIINKAAVTKPPNDFSLKKDDDDDSEPKKQPQQPYFQQPSIPSEILNKVDQNTQLFLTMIQSNNQLALQQAQSQVEIFKEELKESRRIQREEQIEARKRADDNMKMMIELIKEKDKGGDAVLTFKTLNEARKEGKEEASEGNKVMELISGIASGLGAVMIAKQSQQPPYQPPYSPPPPPQERLQNNQQTNEQGNPIVKKNNPDETLKNVMKEVLINTQQHVLASPDKKHLYEQKTKTDYWVNYILKINFGFAKYVAKKTPQEMFEIAKTISADVVQFQSVILEWVTEFLSKLRAGCADIIQKRDEQNRLDAQELVALVQQEAEQEPKPEPVINLEEQMLGFSEEGDNEQ